MTTPGTDCPASSSPSCNFTCPAGGTWYTCQDPPYFVGCCSSDPCTNVSPRSTSPCPDGGLYPASFNPAIFNSFLPNTCIGEENANWFTCNFTTPPFLGCCLTNPCANGSCPQSDLVQAAWTAEGGGVDQFVLFRDEGSSSNDTTGDDGDDSGGDSGGLSAGAIAGIVVGVVALIAVLLALWWFLRRKKKAGRAGGGGGGDGSVAAWHERSASQQQQQQFLATGYQDSPFSSPNPNSTLRSAPGTTTFPSPRSPSGFSAPSLSPPAPSDSGRTNSDMLSFSGSEEGHHQRNLSQGQTYGLGLFGTQKPTPIQELDSNAEVHELEGWSTPRR